MIAPISATDLAAAFRCGIHALDDCFHRHALANDARGISRCFVLRQGKTELPMVAGYYTLSMATVMADAVRHALPGRLPQYPLPVALIGRLAVDLQARGHRFGEWLLSDALGRTLDAADQVGCTGVIVDAKGVEAEGFFAKYDFVSVDQEAWPRRMFLPIGTVRTALGRP